MTSFAVSSYTDDFENYFAFKTKRDRENLVELPSIKFIQVSNGCSQLIRYTIY